MKKFLFALLLVALPVFAEVGEPTLGEIIKRDAQSCAKALLKHDYEGMVKYTHPRVVAGMGGKEAMIVVLKKAEEQMKAQGIGFENATFGAPENGKKVGAWFVATITQRTTLKVPHGKLIHDSDLVAISEDEGKHWVFVDLGPLTEEKFKDLFPELDGEVKMPGKQEPAFQADKTEKEKAEEKEKTEKEKTDKGEK